MTPAGAAATVDPEAIQNQNSALGAATRLAGWSGWLLVLGS